MLTLTARRSLGFRSDVADEAQTTTQTIERAHREAGAVYGTILLLAVVAALSEDEEATSLAILGGVLATSLVFWVAHVYADVLSRRVAGEELPWRPLLMSAAYREWPLVEAAFAPALPLLLSAIGLLGRSAAVTLALAVGLIDLAGWGYVAGRTMRQSRLKSLLSALVAVALGTMMVLLKHAVH